MKRRVTFITAPDADIPKESLKLAKDKLEVRDLPAIREERFTFSVDELPRFVKEIIAEVHELYIRFDNGHNYNALWKGPYISRLPLGTHIFAVPLGKSKMRKLCSNMEKYGNVKCTSIENSFTPSSRSKQFYVPDPTMAEWILGPLSNRICNLSDKACKEKVLEYSKASIDLRYDAISQVLEVTALFDSYVSGNNARKKWDLNIVPQAGGRVEVGVLSAGRRAGPEEVSVQGILAVVGEDTAFKSTAFAFPSRHHDYEVRFRSYFLEPQGLHPKLRIETAPIPIEPAEECTLNAYFTIPQPFFVDPYQLQDEKLMNSLGIKKVRVVAGETDLEAPTWTVDKWGAMVIAELDYSTYKKAGPTTDRLLVADFPLHLRYMPTDPEHTHRKANMPWPSLFWACHSEMWKKMDTNPFDRKMLGYEEHFPEQTFFFHFTPALVNTTYAQSSMEVPVLSSENSHAIYWGTIGVVGVGFVWVFLQILISLFGLGRKKVDEQKKKN